MSDVSSEAHSAVVIACPSSVLQREQSRLTNPEELQHIELHRKPFKLRFGRQHDAGRSAVSSIKPLGLLPIITPKFYTREACQVEADKEMNEKIQQIKSKIDLMYTQGPKQKFKLPKLESQKYGWYHNVNFSEGIPDKKMFYFGINSSTMVRYRVSIIADDKILQQTIKK